MTIVFNHININNIFYKQRTRKLSIRVILWESKRFVGTGKLSKIVSETAKKGMPEAKAMDISEKNTSQSSFAGVSNQQLITPGNDPTAPSDTHYVLKTEEKKGSEPNKEIQKHNYAANASIKKAEEHKNFQQNPSVEKTTETPKDPQNPPTIGAGAGLYSALQHYKKPNSELQHYKKPDSDLQPYQKSTESQYKDSQKTSDTFFVEEKMTDKKSLEEKSDNKSDEKSIKNTTDTSKSNTDSSLSNSSSESSFNESTKDKKENDQPKKSHMGDDINFDQLDYKALEERKIVLEELIKVLEEQQNHILEKKAQEEKEEKHKKALEELCKSIESYKKELQAIEEEKYKKALEEHKGKFKGAKDDIEKIGNEKKNDDNAKPSEVSENMKVKYKSQSGKEYETKITSKTTPETISDADLIDEMKHRELIQDDSGINTSTTFKTENNEEVVVGFPKNKVKITSLGQAYTKKIAEDIPVDSNSMPKFDVQELLFSDLRIIPPLPIPEDTFIETALQKHVLAIVNPQLSKPIIISYLTSKKNSVKLCDKQLKVFQKEQENPDEVIPNKKTQNMVILETPLVINQEDLVSPIAHDKEYLESIPLDIQINLLKDLKTSIKNPPQPFTNRGLTKQDCINMCREHDKTIDNKGKHPLTADQIKKSEANKKKQNEENKKKSKTIQHKQNHDTKD